MAANENSQNQTVATPELETESKPEKQTNCLSCGKPIKKLKRYYRDGKFYCSKNCWLKMKKKTKEEQK